MIIVALILFFVMAATHLLWLSIGHPDSQLLEKGFTMFEGVVTTLTGALVMHFRPGRK